MARRTDGFLFTAELGRRLAALRQRAGLTQRQLASEMGLLPAAGHSLVGRLERGRVRRPTLGVVADYLRACRAGFNDVVDILDRYTSRPTVAAEQGRKAVAALARKLPAKVARHVVNYDIGTEVARRFDARFPEPRHEPVEKRVGRVQKLAASWLRRQRLEDRLHEALNSIGASPRGFRKPLADFGRKVFGILNRTRGRRRGKRRELLDEATGWLVDRQVPREAVEYVRGVVVELHAEMEQGGELDAVPELGEAERLALLSPRDRVKKDEAMWREEWRAKVARFWEARTKFVNDVLREVTPWLDDAGVHSGARPPFIGIVRRCWFIARRTEPGSPEREEMMAELRANPGKPPPGPKLLDRVCRLAFRRYRERKQGLPPDPYAED